MSVANIDTEPPLERRGRPLREGRHHEEQLLAFLFTPHRADGKAGKLLGT